MPKLLTPADIAQRIKDNKSIDSRSIFYDAAGARIAKAIGITASVAPGDDDRSVEFAISTGALDRYNSTIAVNGWQLANYAKNSVVLWAHDDSIPAIARGENTRIEGGAVRSRAVFADRDTHPLADTVFRLVKGKFISAASVGWIPLKWQYVDEEGRGFGVDYLEQELLEWSVVNIPANPECLVEARSVGIDTSPLMHWAERALDLGGYSVIPRDELVALRKAAGAPTLSGRINWSKVRLLNGESPNAARRDAANGSGDETFEQNAAALRTLFENGVIDSNVFSNQLVELSRSGRVLSAENEKKLKTAHDHVKAANDHCTAAMEHVRAVIDQVRDPEDGDCDPDVDPDCDPNEQDPEQNAAAAETQRQRARVLRLKGGNTAAA